MIRRFIIALLILVPMLAFSNEPSIAPIKGGREQQSVSKKYDKKSEPDNRGTDKSPVFIKIIPTEPSHEQSEQETKDKLEKSLNDKVLVYSTLTLTVATILLALFTYRLWSATVKLSKDAKDTSDRQAAEMTKSLDLTQKSIDLAREEFISSHRPQLIIRNVTIKPPHPLCDVIFEDGKPIAIEWSVVNIGDTPAVIVESNATVLMSAKAFSSRIEHSNIRDTMGVHKFLAGEDHTFSLIADDIVFPNYGTFHQLIMTPVAEKVIYFFGFIEYKDAIGTIRRTAFCRSYDPVDKRFIISDDPDYEYAD